MKPVIVKVNEAGYLVNELGQPVTIMGEVTFEMVAAADLGIVLGDEASIAYQIKALQAKVEAGASTEEFSNTEKIVSFDTPISAPPVLDAKTSVLHVAPQQLPTPPKEETVTLPLSALEKLINDKINSAIESIKGSQPAAKKHHTENEVVENNKMMDILSDLSKTIKQQQQGSQMRTWAQPAMDVSLIDQEDHLEIPVVFFQYTQTTTIYDDIRNGHTVAPPYGTPIKFKHLFRSSPNKVGGKTSGNTVAMCIAIIYSKKTAQWLRDHTAYKVRFFEDLREAQSVDSGMSEALMKAEAQVGKNEFNIVQMCKSHGIPHDVDMNKMRSSLIRKMAAEIYTKQKGQAIVPEITFNNSEANNNKSRPHTMNVQ